MFQTILDWLMPPQSRKELQDEIDSLHGETRTYCDALANAHRERLAAENDRDLVIKERDAALNLTQSQAKELVRLAQVVETLSSAVSERDAVIEKVRDAASHRHLSLRLRNILPVHAPTVPTPDVSAEWVILGPDAVMQDGDEFEASDGSWVPTKYKIGSRITDFDGSGRRYRRRVTPDNPVEIDGDKPDVGEGWRDLKEDDILRLGDEVRVGHGAGRWVATVNFGMRVGDMSQPYRRRVTPVEPAAPAKPLYHGYGWRWLAEGETLCEQDERVDAAGKFEKLLNIGWGATADESFTYRRRVSKPIPWLPPEELRELQHIVEKADPAAVDIVNNDIRAKMEADTTSKPEPDAGEGWRKLGEDDVLQDGDEWTFSSGPADWRKLTRDRHGSKELAPSITYRRRVLDTTQPIKPEQGPDLLDNTDSKRFELDQ